MYHPVLNGHVAIGIAYLVSDGVSLCDLALHDAVDGVVPVLGGDPCRVRLFYDCTVAVIDASACLGLSVQRHSRLCCPSQIVISVLRHLPDRLVCGLKETSHPLRFIYVIGCLRDFVIKI